MSQLTKQGRVKGLRKCGFARFVEERLLFSKYMASGWSAQNQAKGININEWAAGASSVTSIASYKNSLFQVPSLASHIFGLFVAFGLTIWSSGQTSAALRLC